jgi:probable aminopeptidase NPEPL1
VKTNKQTNNYFRKITSNESGMPHNITFEELEPVTFTIFFTLGKTAMPGMKRDCGGAAGILGAFYLAVKQGFSQNLHAVFCMAENAVSDRATRPDDIHTLYSGKTVEINNTDAEGRLVLSDGVVYANRDLKANVIVDMCTLTGAQVR